MYNCTNKAIGENMKTIKVSTDTWEILRKIAFDKKISIGKVIEELVQGK